MQFNFKNSILESIIRTDSVSFSSTYKYYDPVVKLKLDALKLATGESKPVWIDIGDLSKVDVGMTEKKIIEQIGQPSQLIFFGKKGLNNIKKVF